ncbi:MAG: glycoside hydrolase family 92 protein [Solirubrobacterales bacterium]|nr:glycoside hydrolase family 92 protein [Solirubrobacterales bacterium]
MLLPATARGADLARHIDPTIGTMAPGFTFPGADAPFGMVQNSPDTLGPLVYSGYMHHDALIRGFSLVHLSGPGVAKAGDLPFMPWTLPQAPPSDPTQYASPYNHATEQAQAGYYRVLLANGTDVELTAATHAAMQRYSFPPAGDAYLVVNPKQRNSGATEGAFRRTGPSEIAGWTRSDYPVFFVARFSEPIEDVGPHWVRFAPGAAVTMRVGISFVDEDGARRNLDADAPDTLSFDEMRARAYAAWNREMNRIRVQGGAPGNQRSFYTALYHSMLHPNVFTDVDGRYRGFDDQVHDAGGRVQYANFSSWDTYKSTNQLQALLVPGRYADMLRSLLADADADPAHRLPRWGEENHDAGHMSGDPVIPMIADGACRGLLGSDEEQALYARAVALRGFRDPALDGKGYLPMKPGTTLEYGVADFALALLAEHLGKHEDAQRWLHASLDYRNLLDPATKWIRPREADGSWYAGFDPAFDETGFQEGNSWQYSWLVPQDPRGLFDRMGGDAAVADRLDELFAAPAEAQTKATFFGTLYRLPQWAPGNEHDLGAPFMYGFAGQPYKLQAEMRAAQLLYRPTVDGLPGNDDLGGLSSWFVFSALGFGPFTPGAPLYMVGSPMFERAAIELPRGRFVVDAPGASLAARYVQSAQLDGRPLTRAWFADRAIRRNGTLRLVMGPTANEAWASDRADVPPSASDAPLEAFGCVH